MSNLIECGGYSFKTIKETNPHRPYKVCCVETGGQKDSAISYQDAINLLLCEINYANTKLDVFSKDAEQVKKLFEEKLLNRKKSECDAIVEDIVYKQIIRGDIFKLPETEKYENQIKYQTEHFLVVVHFEKRFCGATKITVEAI